MRIRRIFLAIVAAGLAGLMSSACGPSQNQQPSSEPSVVEEAARAVVGTIPEAGSTTTRNTNKNHTWRLRFEGGSTQPLIDAEAEGTLLIAAAQADGIAQQNNDEHASRLVEIEDAREVSETVREKKIAATTAFWNTMEGIAKVAMPIIAGALTITISYGLVLGLVIVVLAALVWLVIWFLRKLYRAETETNETGMVTVVRQTLWRVIQGENPLLADYSENANAHQRDVRTAEAISTAMKKVGRAQAAIEGAATVAGYLTDAFVRSRQQAPVDQRSVTVHTDAETGADIARRVTSDE